MKMKIAIWITVFLLGMVVPGVVASIAIPDWEETTAPPETSVSVTTIPETTHETANEFMVPILMDDGMIHEMTLDEYITGVVLREMPASFELEALKAQAVVARTYTLKQLNIGKKHPGCAVCTDSNCCQGYYKLDAYLSAGGSQADVEKIRQAVSDTQDLVLIYEDELIDATYFSCSGGKTEDAVSVWGAQVPYLQSVESPGEQNSVHYIDTVSFSAAEFESLLGSELQGEPEQWFGSVTYTAGGGVATIEIADKLYEGVTLRRLLGLKSTAFAVTAVGSTVTITTKGFGHRVGMSQYGADAMALNGATYPDILAHYYPGTQLRTLNNN